MERLERAGSSGGRGSGVQRSSAAEALDGHRASVVRRTLRLHTTNDYSMAPKPEFWAQSAMERSGEASEAAPTAGEARPGGGRRRAAHERQRHWQRLDWPASARDTGRSASEGVAPNAADDAPES